MFKKSQAQILRDTAEIIETHNLRPGYGGWNNPVRPIDQLCLEGALERAAGVTHADYMAAVALIDSRAYKELQAGLYELVQQRSARAFSKDSPVYTYWDSCFLSAQSVVRVLRAAADKLEPKARRIKPSADYSTFMFDANLVALDTEMAKNTSMITKVKARIKKALTLAA